MSKSSLDKIVCTPSRKPLKFIPKGYSRHCLSFDSWICREDRQLLFTEIFLCAPDLIDHQVVSGYTEPKYVPEEYLELRIVCDHRHPAFGQLGLYAKKNIPSNFVVTSYAGFIEIFTASCNSRTYTMGFGSIGDDFALDAEFSGNYGRFANDPRGVVGRSANLVAESRNTPRGESFTALVSRRQILEGEEILMSYGKAHSLSSSPWSSVEGKIVLRHRLGGMVPLPPNKDPEQSYHLMWECPQCGLWSEGGESRLQVRFCGRCGTPQTTGCPLVGLIGQPPVALQSSTLSSCVEDTGEDSKKANNQSGGDYHTVKTEWPMNMPFLPWQVWDPSVPIATVLKHSHFESQDFLLLYSVSVSLQSDETEDSDEERLDKKNERKRSRQVEMWERQEITELPHQNSYEESYTGGETCEPSEAASFPGKQYISLELSTQVSRLLQVKHDDSDSIDRITDALVKIKRRLYTGKSFNTGELVGFVGGIIRHADDIRCSPDDSPLQIPMKYLIPWRKSGDSEANPADGPMSQVKRDLYLRLSKLVLTVTNEMMYCPCLTFEGGCGSKDLLEVPNVIFLLTVDSLGCPYIACIALRRLNAFEPLLARVY